MLYFVGTFLPRMVTVVLVVPLAVIDSHATLMQPFLALASAGSDGGAGAAAGPDSRTLRFAGGFLGSRVWTTPVAQASSRGRGSPCCSWPA